MLLNNVKPMNDDFYTPYEVAEKLKVSYMTVYRWIRSGKLSAVKAGKQYRVKKEDLESFYNEHTVKK